jgi:predicted restriction endonuclease
MRKPLSLAAKQIVIALYRLNGRRVTKKELWLTDEKLPALTTVEKYLPMLAKDHWISMDEGLFWVSVLQMDAIRKEFEE